MAGGVTSVVEETSISERPATCCHTLPQGHHQRAIHRLISRRLSSVALCFDTAPEVPPCNTINRHGFSPLMTPGPSALRRP